MHMSSIRPKIAIDVNGRCHVICGVMRIPTFAATSAIVHLAFVHDAGIPQPLYPGQSHPGSDIRLPVADLCHTELPVRIASANALPHTHQPERYQPDSVFPCLSPRSVIAGQSGFAAATIVTQIDRCVIVVNIRLAIRANLSATSIARRVLMPFTSAATTATKILPAIREMPEISRLGDHTSKPTHTTLTSVPRRHARYASSVFFAAI
jgi:hypothetical protein